MKTNKAVGKTGIINWITVWGFIFGCIAFNLYFDNQETKRNGNWYRSQYEAESQRADSLHKAAVKLEQRLQEVESGSIPKVSASQVDTPHRLVPSSEL